MHDVVPTLYDQLGVTRDADEATLKRAYRAQLRATHPDTTGVDSHVQYDLVQRAWDVLGDPLRRAQYDAWLDSRDQPAAAAPPEPPSEAASEPRVASEASVEETEPAREPGRRTTAVVVTVGVGAAVGGAVSAVLAGAQWQDLQMMGLCAVVLLGFGGWTWRTAGWRPKPMLAALGVCLGLAVLMWAATQLPEEVSVSRPLAVPVGMCLIGLGIGAVTWRLAMRRRAKYVWSFD